MENIKTNKNINTYKPKQSNVEKLLTYLSKLK